jgi:hypothetical protein
MNSPGGGLKLSRWKPVQREEQYTSPSSSTPLCEIFGALTYLGRMFCLFLGVRTSEDMRGFVPLLCSSGQ